MGTRTIDLRPGDESHILEDSEHVIFVVLHWGKNVRGGLMYCKFPIFPELFCAESSCERAASILRQGRRLITGLGTAHQGSWHPKRASAESAIHLSDVLPIISTH